MGLFDWQARAFFVPVGTPNMVTTVFVANAFLDYLAADERRLTQKNLDYENSTYSRCKTKFHEDRAYRQGLKSYEP